MKPWTANEVSILRKGYLVELLEGNALRRWCGGRGLMKTDYEIAEKLKDLRYFVPKDDDETVKAERSRILVAAMREYYEKKEKEAVPHRVAAVKGVLAREIAMAKAEAPTAPLFRPSVKEQERWLKQA